MLVDHASAQACIAEEAPLAVPASYRRGILRAKIVVTDLTCWSADFAAVESLRPGTSIWVTLARLEAKQATVVRVDGFTAHVRFEAPLYPPVLDALLAGQLARRH